MGNVDILFALVSDWGCIKCIMLVSEAVVKLIRSCTAFNGELHNS